MVPLHQCVNDVLQSAHHAEAENGYGKSLLLWHRVTRHISAPFCQCVVGCRSILSSRPDNRGPCQCRPLCKNSNTHSCYCWSGRRWRGWHSLLPIQRGTVCMLMCIHRISVPRLVLLQNYCTNFLCVPNVFTFIMIHSAASLSCKRHISLLLACLQLVPTALLSSVKDCDSVPGLWSGRCSP